MLCYYRKATVQSVIYTEKRGFSFAPMIYTAISELAGKLRRGGLGWLSFCLLLSHTVPLLYAISVLGL